MNVDLQQRYLLLDPERVWGQRKSVKLTRENCENILSFCAPIVDADMLRTEPGPCYRCSSCGKAYEQCSPPLIIHRPKCESKNRFDAVRTIIYDALRSAKRKRKKTKRGDKS